MSSLTYRIKGSTTKKEVSIYVRFSVGRSTNLELKTGFTVSPSAWSPSKQMPKLTSPELKILNRDLKKLEFYIYESCNLAQSDGVQITKGWLEHVIQKCFDRPTETEQLGVVEHIQYIIDNAEVKRIPGRNSLGLSKARVVSYRTFKKSIQAFEIHQRKKLLLKELDQACIDRFKMWLLKTKKFSKNYAGKQLDNLRAVSNDAKRIGLEVHPSGLKIESFTESNEERSIVTLSPEELQLIAKTEMPSNYLENAKKWLLIGCEIGQRAGDLLAMSPIDLRVTEDYFFIDMLQQKTKKEVTIPVGSKAIQELLTNNFPHPISGQNLNKYIKEVCELAGINEVVDGKILDRETNRKVAGQYPKHMLVTSHCFRRSFATNYYKKMATPILMTVTGHSKESMFLKYINRQEDKDENAKLFLQYYNQLKD